jgi:dTMP kinase
MSDTTLQFLAGKFVTFEGIEGVGKSTQVASCSASLQRAGIEHLVTREPGGTPLAERIRTLVLEIGDEIVPPSAELLLMFAARAVHLANRIVPALTAGKLVICDRFTDATYAYQGAGRGTDPAIIATLARYVQESVQPDLTLLFDMPVPVALGRAQRRSAADRFEREREEFFERVRAGYLRRAAAEPRRFVIIDAAQDRAQVSTQVTAAFASRLSIKLPS